MKLSMILKKLLPGLALLVATTAFAGNKASFKVPEAVTVNGHQLTPGEYQFRWEGSGPSVELKILSEGKLVTTVPAHMVEQTHPNERTTLTMLPNSDGTKTLSQIDFGGKKYGLVLGEDSVAASTQSNNNAATSKR